MCSDSWTPFPAPSPFVSSLCAGHPSGAVLLRAVPGRDSGRDTVRSERGTSE